MLIYQVVYPEYNQGYQTTCEVDVKFKMIPIR